MKGWYGNKYKHGMASKGIKSKGLKDIPEDDLIDQLFGTKVVSKFHKKMKNPDGQHTLETIWVEKKLSEEEIAYLIENGYMPRTEGVGAFMKIQSGDTIHMIPKELDYIGTMGDLLKISKDFNIASIYTGDVVRHIYEDGDTVAVDVMSSDEPIRRFDKNTPVFYEEWFMDRGSYLIWIDDMNQFGKLATEYDKVIT